MSSPKFSAHHKASRATIDCAPGARAPSSLERDDAQTEEEEKKSSPITELSHDADITRLERFIHNHPATAIATGVPFETITRARDLHVPSTAMLKAADRRSLIAHAHHYADILKSTDGIHTQRICKASILTICNAMRDRHRADRRATRLAAINAQMGAVKRERKEAAESRQLSEAAAPQFARDLYPRVPRPLPTGTKALPRGVLKWAQTKAVSASTALAELPPPLPSVSKADAAAPVQPNERAPPMTSEPSSGGLWVPHGDNPVRSKAESPSCSVAPVVLHVQSTPTHITNLEGRTYQPDFDTYTVRLPSVRGFAQDAPGSACDTVIGFREGGTNRDVHEVALPKGLVEQVSSLYLTEPDVGNLGAHRNAVTLVQSIIRPLTLTPLQVQDALFYAPIVASNIRRDERRSAFAALHAHNVDTKHIRRLGTASALAAVAGAYAAKLLGCGVALDAASAAASAFITASVGARWLQPARGASIVERKRIVSTNAPALHKPRNPNAFVDLSRVESPDTHAVKEESYPGGISSVHYGPQVYANNVNNHLRAIEKRILGAEKPIDLDNYRGFMSWVKANRQHLFGPRRRVTPMPFEAWIKKCGARPSAIAAYTKRYEEMKRDGSWDSPSYTPREAKNLSRHKCTIKREFSVNTALGEEPTKAPRLIQGCDAEFTIRTGPWFTAAQSIVSEFLDGTNGLMIGIGKDARKVAEHLMKFGPDGTIDEDDVSNWDGDFRALFFGFFSELLDWLGAPAYVVALCRAEQHKVGVMPSGIIFEVMGKMGSGVAWTALLNSLFNAAVHAYEFCKDRSISNFEKFRDHAAFVFTGDDDTMAYTGARIDWKAIMAKYGFTSTAVHRPDAFSAEFCSARIYQDSKGYTLAPKFGRTLCKGGHSLTAQSEQEAVRYARGAALSSYDISRSIPPFRAYVDRILAITEQVSAKAENSGFWSVFTNSPGEATDESWACLFKNYGWTREMQVEWERELSEVTTLPAVLMSQNMRRLIDADFDGRRQLEVSDRDNLCIREFALEPPPSSASMSELVAPVVSAAEHITTVHFAAASTIGAVLHPTLITVGLATLGIICATRTAHALASMLTTPSTPEATADDTAVHDAIAHHLYVNEWAISRRARNRAAHAANGNIDRPTPPSSPVSPHPLPPLEEEFSPEGVAWLNRAFSDSTFVHRARVPVTTPRLVPAAWNQNRLLAPFLDRAFARCSDLIVESAIGSSPVAWDDVIAQVTATIADFLDNYPDCRPDGTETVANGWWVGLQSELDRLLPLLMAPVVYSYVWSLSATLRNARAHADNGNGYTWALSARQRNRAQHALNGNPNVTMLDRAFDLLAAATGCTKEGSDWVRVAVDPMHDTATYCRGYPDNNTSSSFPQTIKGSVSITMPTTTANYDVYFVSWPMLNQIGAAVTPVFGGGTIATYVAPPLRVWGGVCVYIVTAGAAVDYTQNPNFQFNLPPAVVARPLRLFAGSMEVYNTTPQLNLSGTATVFQVPTEPTSATGTLNVYWAANNTATSYTPLTFDAYNVPLPPTTVSAALALEGTIQWAASGGAYVPSRFNSSVLPIYDISGAGALAFPMLLQGTNSLINNFGTVVLPTNGTLPTPTIPFSNSETVFSNTNITGIIMSNVSGFSTFNLEVKNMIETFPTQSTDPLIYSATASPAFDPKSIELYGIIIRHLPIGVPVCENGFGDWFSSAVSAVSNFVGKASDAVAMVAQNIPGVGQTVANVARLVGTGARAVEGISDSYGSNRNGNAVVSDLSTPVLNTPQPTSSATLHRAAPAVIEEIVIEAPVRPKKKKAAAKKTTTTKTRKVLATAKKALSMLKR
jgi:hypothetical protein